MKNYFYKITYINSYYHEVPKNIEHNIPSDFIFNINDLNIKYDKEHNSLNHEILYAYILKDEFINKINNHYFFPLESKFKFNLIYIGSIILRTDKGEILTYINCDKNYEKYFLIPVLQIINNNYTIKISNKKIKCFIDKNSLNNYLKEKEEKQKEEEQKNALKNLLIKTFSLKSTTFKVIKIIEKTNKLILNEGDIFYGEIPFLKEQDDEFIGLFNNYSYSINYIDCYVNNIKVKTLSLFDFQTLFTTYYKFEQLK